MGQKRPREPERGIWHADVVAKPSVGSRTFTSGKSVKGALASGNRQSLVALNQQILTLYSEMPLPINHPTVVILEHYLDVSPTCDEVFSAWKEAAQIREERQAEAAVALLAHIIQVLTPLPFFRTSLIGLVKKLISPTEPYSDLLNRFITSGKREQILFGLQLAAAAVHVDPPKPSTSSSGRLALGLWAVLVEGGSVRGLGKVLAMRRRNKDGSAEYPDKDPLDKPDIRHLCLQLILPIVSTSAFQAHAKQLLPDVYANLHSDPPITVHRVLSALWSAITAPSSGIGRRTALSLLNETSIENLLGLLSRDDLEPTTGRTVSDMVMAFLEGVTATPGQGVCFPDEGWYPRREKDNALGMDDEAGEEAEKRGMGDGRGNRFKNGLHNRILSNVVRRMGLKAIDDKGRIAEWMLKVLQACPEIVAGYWPHSGLSLNPRLNAQWMATMAHLGRIISLPPPAKATFQHTLPGATDSDPSPFRSNPPSVSTIVESVLPSPLTNLHLTKGLQHSDGLVQHVTALTLARALEKLELVQKLFRDIEAELEAEPGSSAESPWARRSRELEMECRKRVPDVLVVIAFAQKSATLARVNPDSADEPDQALLAKSTMLTESALRLFELYYRALPSIPSEVKFDIGKLLVSASSAKAERREWREARAGSVISDTGSVRSVGTVGTAGMGGGFGHARGDVIGFEALSQAHVLSLLSQVREWNWSGKAAGSQYTYLYHILLLHLTTPHPITQTMTTALLHRLLLSSILFDHDQGELDIWLSALPRLSQDADLASRATLLTQQIYLLSFLDDCFRRAIKTPYRYIDDSMPLVPDYFSPSKPHEMVCPVIMTVLEQLNAKILGELISTDAAGVVMCWLRRAMLGLSGKMRDGKFLEAVVGRLRETLDAAKEKGQSRTGLRAVLKGIRDELHTVFGSVEGMEVDGEDNKAAPELVDERRVVVFKIDATLICFREWIRSSFERIILGLLITSTPDQQFGEIQELIDKAPDSAANRMGCFCVHLLSSASNTDRIRTLLRIIERSLIHVKDKVLAARLRDSVFDGDTLRAMLTTVKGDDFRNVLGRIVAILRGGDTGDRSLAEGYVRQIIDKSISSKKAKRGDVVQFLAILKPWTGFLDLSQAAQTFCFLSKSARLLSISLPDQVASTISAIIIATQDPAVALEQLHRFLPLGVISPFTVLLRDRLHERDHANHGSKIQEILIPSDTLQNLVGIGSDEAFDLLEALVSALHRTAKSLGNLLNQGAIQLQDSRLLPCIGLLLDLNGALSLEEIAPKAASVAFGALLDASLTIRIQCHARRILRQISLINSATVVQAISTLALNGYGLPVAKFGESVAQAEISKISPALLHLINTGLRWAVRALSSDATPSDDQLKLIRHLFITIRASPTLEVDLKLAEAVITAVIQERLSVAEATEVAALLSSRCTFGASFVRQKLQLLFSNATIGSSPNRSSIINLIQALFRASPWASCQPTFLSRLLPLYRGTMSIPDKQILSLFQLFESHRTLSTASLLKSWSASGVIGVQRALDAMMSLAAGKVFATCIAFSMRRALLSDGPTDGAGEGFYDPAFILPLFVAVLDEHLTGLDWVQVLRSNLLGLAICSLASRDAAMRALGRRVLAKTTGLISTTPFQERDQLVYILRLLQHAITTPSIRLPTLTTLFLAHTLRALASPSHYLYPLASRFLFQRPTLDLFDVPMLYSMLYASGDGFKKERGWIIRLLRDGVRSDADWRILRRRRTFDLLATSYQSSLDTPFRRLILQALESMSHIPSASLSLTHRSNILNWLNMQWALTTAFPNRAAEEEKAAYERMVENLVINLVVAELCRDVKEDDGRERVWVTVAERFVGTACQDADRGRLEVLVRIALRLSSIPGSESATKLLPALVNRLVALDPASTAERAASGATIEHLFRASLALEPGQMGPDVKEAVDELSWRVGRSDSEVGDWVRRERRRAEWEAMTSS